MNGVLLAGGGAHGAFEIGVLKAMISLGRRDAKKQIEEMRLSTPPSPPAP